MEKSLLASLTRPVIFAHRGSSAHAPENTLAAFELAVQQEAGAIELDVKLCASGEPVVIHDMTVDRTTNGSGTVKHISLCQLKELDAGSHFHASFSNEKIPTLDEVFESIGRKIYINVELTNLNALTDRLPEEVARCIQKHRLEQQVLISSFNPIALRRFHALIPQIPIGLLSLPSTGSINLRPALQHLVHHDALHPHLGDASQQLIDRAHQRGKRVHLYTVNDPGDMRRLYSLGADGIFTDDPVLALQVRMAFLHESRGVHDPI
jgi:glycerophosphoryl diester phosphodiesterase